MFQQFKNIDSAFKLSRSIAILAVLGSFGFCIFTMYSNQKLIRDKDNKVLVLANGKIFEAFAAERDRYWDIEIKDHVQTFHLFFFTLQPDENYIKKNITKVLYLADNSAKSEYDNLRENGYYSSLISANISQDIDCDSVTVDLNSVPWTFRYSGKVHVVRATNKVTRSIITEGTIRKVKPSDNNPHGLLIERWHVIENKDIGTSNR